MSSMENEPKVLTVICNHKIMGYIAVRENHVRENSGRRIIGDFSPGPDYVEFQSLCELMAEWEQKFVKSSQVDYAGEIDPYWAWDKWMEAIQQLDSLGLEISELSNAVEELSIDRKGEVVMFLL